MELLGFGLTTVGEVMVALTVLLVHHRVNKEHGIDRKVLISIQHEQAIGAIGVLFIVIGFALQLPSKF